MRRCNGTNIRGERCGAPAGASGYCLAHDPARQGEHRALSAKGGRVSRKVHDLAAPPEEMPPATFTIWLRSRLVEVWQRLEAGAIEPSVANAFSSLANSMKGLVEAQVSLDELVALAAEVEALRAERAA